MLDQRYGPLPLAWWLPIGLAAVGVIFGTLNAVWNRSYPFVDGRISGVVGRMGQGKSIFLVLRVMVPFCRALNSRGGEILSPTGRPVRRIVTNFTFNSPWPNVEVRTVSARADLSLWDAVADLACEIGDVESPSDDPCVRCGGPHSATINGLVLLDELHLYASSSRLTMDEGAAWVTSMARKMNAELWWASQNEMKVHKRLRDDTQDAWMASKLSGPLTLLVGRSWHVCNAYTSWGALARARENAGTDRVPRSRERRFYRYTRRVKPLYNSFELLPIGPPRGSVRPVRPVPRSVEAESA